VSPYVYVPVGTSPLPPWLPSMGAAGAAGLSGGAAGGSGPSAPRRQRVGWRRGARADAEGVGVADGGAGAIDAHDIDEAAIKAAAASGRGAAHFAKIAAGPRRLAALGIVGVAAADDTISVAAHDPPLNWILQIRSGRSGSSAEASELSGSAASEPRDPMPHAPRSSQVC
jgi:hypothetical protein